VSPAATFTPPTNDGLRFAVFYSKVHNRLLRPLITSDQPQAPPELRAAFRTIDHHIHQTPHPRTPPNALKLTTNLKDSATKGRY
jgi:hypothetical protein